MLRSRQQLLLLLFVRSRAVYAPRAAASAVAVVDRPAQSSGCPGRHASPSSAMGRLAPNVVVAPLFLLKLSRPYFWLVTFWLYLLPTGRRFDLLSSGWFWCGLAYCTLPLNLLCYLMNDLSDVEVDQHNPRKGGPLLGIRAGAPALQAAVRWTAAAQLPFLLLFAASFGAVRCAALGCSRPIAPGPAAAHAHAKTTASTTSSTGVRVASPPVACCASPKAHGFVGLRCASRIGSSCAACTACRAAPARPASRTLPRSLARARPTPRRSTLLRGSAARRSSAPSTAGPHRSSARQRWPRRHDRSCRPLLRRTV